MKKTGEPLTLTELIERLQELANVKGEYDSKESLVKFHFDGEDYYITNAIITVVDPNYNFDEANCGPDTEVDLYFV